MGIGFVLLVWTVVGAALASVASLLLGGAVGFLTRDAVSATRKRIIFAARLFPFACLAWAACIFLFQAAINTTLFHSDPGFGDSWNCQLPDGYALLMVDTPDEGVVYNPKTQPMDGTVIDQNDATDRVRVIQISGSYIFGGSGKPVTQSDAENNQVPSYFLLDTLTGKQSTFLTYNALRAEAHRLGVDLDLQPIYAVYSKYRFTWFDLVAALLLFLPPLIFVILLARWTIKLRRTRLIIPHPAQQA